MANVGTTPGTDGKSAPEPGEVRSADGTVISYYQVGQGPPLILLHGAGQSSENLSTLARQLSDSFTVFVPTVEGGAGAVHTATSTGFVARSRTSLHCWTPWELMTCLASVPEPSSPLKRPSSGLSLQDSPSTSRPL